jgi:ParB-like chromosome segregation protein Spo0J
MVSTQSLVPYARNARVHSDEQVARIMGSIREWGFTQPILRDETGLVVAGHGRLLAAQRMGLETVPVVTARGWSEAKRRAYTIADNAIALKSEWNEDLLSVELSDLADMGVELDALGFDGDELESLLDGNGLPGDADAEDDSTYSRKIEAPIYEIKGDKPELESLIDTTKTDELIRAIDAADIPDDVAAFLRHAAQRHTVLHFGRIAEYYAHAPAEIQDLMEQSALVIIDFDKAIEGGFVTLTERIQALYAQDYPEDADDDA